MVFPCKMFRNVGYIQWSAEHPIRFIESSFGGSPSKSYMVCFLRCDWVFNLFAMYGLVPKQVLYDSIYFGTEMNSCLIFHISIPQKENGFEPYLPKHTWLKWAYPNQIFFSEPPKWESQASRLRRLMKRSRESKHKKLTALKEAARACGWLTSQDGQPAFWYHLTLAFLDPCCPRSSSKWCPLCWSKLFKSYD